MSTYNPLSGSTVYIYLPDRTNREPLIGILSSEPTGDKDIKSATAKIGRFFVTVQIQNAQINCTVCGKRTENFTIKWVSGKARKMWSTF